MVDRYQEINDNIDRLAVRYAAERKALDWTLALLGDAMLDVLEGRADPSFGGPLEALLASEGIYVQRPKEPQHAH